MSICWRRFGGLPGCCAAAAMAVFAGGCATPALDSARREFYLGRPEQAAAILDAASIHDRDRILFMMERGTAHQAAGSYDASARDFNEAHLLLEASDTLSISHGVSSMVINDNVLTFKGYPFERTYLHVMAAITYLAEADWSGAAVEARRLIKRYEPAVIGDYPEDAFSHYVAGLCLELVDDHSSAGVEYRKASKLLSGLRISDGGRFYPASESNEQAMATAADQMEGGQTELICLVMVGRVADYSAGLSAGASAAAPRVDLYHADRRLDSAHLLTDTRRLAMISEQKQAALKAAKTATRVAGKYAVAHEIGEHDAALGALSWIVLMALEQPDFRHWETLPRYLLVARVACPSDLDYIEVALRGSGKGVRVRIDDAIRRKGFLFVGFQRRL